MIRDESGRPSFSPRDRKARETAIKKGTKQIVIPLKLLCLELGDSCS